MDNPKGLATGVEIALLQISNSANNGRPAMQGTVYTE
jgi:hypothetical protein